MLITGGLITMGPYCEGCPESQIASSAEIYDPKTGKFTPTGSMSTPRSGHTATLLQDGRVFVLGGAAFGEIYEPKTGKFTQTRGPLHNADGSFASTLLTDGRVLVIGSVVEDPGKCGADAEIFNPATGKFTETGALLERMCPRELVRLKDGRVLVVGSNDGVAQSPEIYDPGSGRFGAVVTSRGVGGLDQPTDATLLEDGRVMIVGSWNQSSRDWIESYDPRTNTLSTVATSSDAPYDYGLSVLQDGRVLVVGNLFGEEVFDPRTSTLAPAGLPKLTDDEGGLCDPVGVVLPNGNVLLTGGEPCGDDISTTYSDAELYTP